MSSVQGKSPLVQVKEPYGNLDMATLQPGVYKVHLPIMFLRASGSIKIKKEKVFIVFQNTHLGGSSTQRVKTAFLRRWCYTYWVHVIYRKFTCEMIKAHMNGVFKVERRRYYWFITNCKFTCEMIKANM